MSVPFHDIYHKITLRGNHSLALGLLGDVTDGGALLANDGTHVLCGHQQSERDVSVLMFGGDSRTRRHLAGVSSWTVSGTTAIVWASLRVDLRVLVGDV